jgi:hypothetical protein
MRNIPDKSCRENQNTHFMFSNSPLPPPRKSCPFIKYLLLFQGSNVYANANEVIPRPHYPWVHTFPKIQKKPENSMRQDRDVMQVPSSGCTSITLHRTKFSSPEQLAPANRAPLPSAGRRNTLIPCFSRALRSKIPPPPNPSKAKIHEQLTTTPPRTMFQYFCVILFSHPKHYDRICFVCFYKLLEYQAAWLKDLSKNSNVLIHWRVRVIKQYK